LQVHVRRLQERSLEVQERLPRMQVQSWRLQRQLLQMKATICRLQEHLRQEPLQSGQMLRPLRRMHEHL
jgi:hypothetical protein